MTNHKHLRTVIEDIYSNNNELTEELTFRLINEFRYSNLYIPAKRENGTLKSIGGFETKKFDSSLHEIKHTLPHIP